MPTSAEEGNKTMTTHPIIDDGTAELRCDMAQKAAVLSDDALHDELAFANAFGPYKDEEEPEELWFEILQLERAKRGLPEDFGNV
jgi:hypothetical protein